MSFQMTAKTLNALKGWPSLSAVDFSAKFDPGIPSIDLPVPPGACVSLNSAGNYILGVGNSKVMPLFTFYGSDDPSVTINGGNPATDPGVYVGFSPSGNALALVGCGAYELLTTNFVAGSYPPNTALTSAKSGGSNPGKLVAGTMHTNMIVGIVSRGVINNGYGHAALAFWPCPVFPA